MKSHVLRTFLLVGIVLFPGVAWSQGGEAEPWGPNTTLSLFGGVVSPDEGLGGGVVASIGWEFTRSFAIEGSGGWITGPGAGFAGLLGPRLSVRAPSRVVPSLFAGVGVWVESRQEPLGDQSVEKTFEEFLFAGGVGVDFFLSHHLVIRPDVRVMFIASDPDIRVVPMFGVQFVYHFDAHPYLP